MKILKIAVLCFSCVLLAACGEGSDGTPHYNPPPKPAPGAPVSVFNPVASQPETPFPNNLLFRGSRDGTVNADPADFTFPKMKTKPLIQALDKLDGFSTTAAAYVDFDRPLSASQDFSKDVLVFRLDKNGHIKRQLKFGISDVMGLGKYSVSGDYTVRLEDDSSGSKNGQRLLMQPLKPLRPQTRYLVVVTNHARGADGKPVGASPFFRAVVSSTPIDDSTIPEVAGLSATQKKALTGIQKRYRPLFQQLSARGVSPTHLVNAWTYTTESIGHSLNALYKQKVHARSIALADTGKTTSNFGGNGSAEVYVGTVTLPYHLGVPTQQDPLKFLDENWQRDPNQIPASGTTPMGANCASITPPTSTTNCYPLPLQTALVTVPVLATVPLANGVPETGDSVVIMQHGVTKNRTDLLYVADSLAKKHLVGIAIDMPLHGITSPKKTKDFTLYDGPPINGQQGDYENLYKASERITAPNVQSPPALGCVPAGSMRHCFGERTFNYPNNGSVNPSGLHYLNAGALAAVRDYGRETVAGLMNLYATLHASSEIQLVDAGGSKAGQLTVDNDHVSYFGHSLGAINGAVFTAVESDASFPSVLASPGGQITRLLLGSPTIPVMLLVKAAYQKPGQTLVNNSRSVQMFARIAQTTIDKSDPENYVGALAKGYSGPLRKSNHPVYLIEAVGNGKGIVPDQTVPNNVLEAPYLGNGNAVQPAPLAGTDPMIAIMGMKKELLTPPISRKHSEKDFFAGQFTKGGHSTVLYPAKPAQASTTVEMQCEAAAFLSSGGKAVPVGCGQ